MGTSEEVKSSGWEKHTDRGEGPDSENPSAMPEKEGDEMKVKYVPIKRKPKAGGASGGWDGGLGRKEIFTERVPTDDTFRKGVVDSASQDYTNSAMDYEFAPGQGVYSSLVFGGPTPKAFLLDPSGKFFAWPMDYESDEGQHHGEFLCDKKGGVRVFGPQVTKVLNKYNEEYGDYKEACPSDIAGLFMELGWCRGGITGKGELYLDPGKGKAVDFMLKSIPAEFLLAKNINGEIPVLEGEDALDAWKHRNDIRHRVRAAKDPFAGLIRQLQINMAGATPLPGFKTISQMVKFGADVMIENGYAEGGDDFLGDVDAMTEQFESVLRELNEFVQKNSLKLYRAINITDTDIPGFLDSLRSGKTWQGYHGLGIYWSWSDSTESYWGNTGGKVLLSATVPVESVDWREALGNQLVFNGEAEISLRRGASLQLDSITYFDVLTGREKSENIGGLPLQAEQSESYHEHKFAPGAKDIRHRSHAGEFPVEGRLTFGADFDAPVLEGEDALDAWKHRNDVRHRVQAGRFYPSEKWWVSPTGDVYSFSVDDQHEDPEVLQDITECASIEQAYSSGWARAGMNNTCLYIQTGKEASVGKAIKAMVEQVPDALRATELFVDAGGKDTTLSIYPGDDAEKTWGRRNDVRHRVKGSLTISGESYLVSPKGVLKPAPGEHERNLPKKYREDGWTDTSPMQRAQADGWARVIVNDTEVYIDMENPEAGVRKVLDALDTVGALAGQGVLIVESIKNNEIPILGGETAQQAWARRNDIRHRPPEDRTGVQAHLIFAAEDCPFCGEPYFDFSCDCRKKGKEVTANLIFADEDDNAAAKLARHHDREVRRKEKESAENKAEQERLAKEHEAKRKEEEESSKPAEKIEKPKEEEAPKGNVPQDILEQAAKEWDSALTQGLPLEEANQAAKAQASAGIMEEFKKTEPALFKQLADKAFSRYKAAHEDQVVSVLKALESPTRKNGKGQGAKGDNTNKGKQPDIPVLDPPLNPQERMFTKITDWNERGEFFAEPTKVSKEATNTLKKSKNPAFKPGEGTQPPYAGKGNYFEWSYIDEKASKDEAKRERETSGVVTSSPRIWVKRLEPWKKYQEEQETAQAPKEPAEATAQPKQDQGEKNVPQ